MAAADVEKIAVETRAEWRAWLERNQERGSSIWLVTTKRSAGGALAPADVTEEALCFGWVDSLPRALDETRTMILVSPRKAKGSNWSALNKARVERLTAEGAMAPRGLAVVEAARRDGSWDALDGVEALAVPADLQTAFLAHEPAATLWETFPRSVKRAILEWILNAKSPETREKRILETALKAAKGERANQWRQK